MSQIQCAQSIPSRESACEEDMTRTLCLRNAVAGPGGCVREGRDAAAKADRGRWWSWMTYQGVWILLCSDGQPLKEFCSVRICDLYTGIVSRKNDNYKEKKCYGGVGRGKVNINTWIHRFTNTNYSCTVLGKSYLNVVYMKRFEIFNWCSPL